MKKDALFYGVVLTFIAFVLMIVSLVFDGLYRSPPPSPSSSTTRRSRETVPPRPSCMPSSRA